MSINRLGIIPARSGSKGVTDKNIRPVNGKPLLHYTVEAAEASRLSEYIVSTDSEEFASVARDAGAPVPFLRPAELATDQAPTIDVVKHAVEWYEGEKCDRIDEIVLLQPTTPLRTGTDIDASIDRFAESDAGSLITVYEAVDAHPNYMYEPLEKNRVIGLRDQKSVPDRRQEFEPVYLRNGAVYISTREMVFEHNRIYGERPVAYVMPKDRSVNIDEPFDLKMAELLLEERNEEDS